MAQIMPSACVLRRAFFQTLVSVISPQSERSCFAFKIYTNFPVFIIFLQNLFNSVSFRGFIFPWNTTSTKTYLEDQFYCPMLNINTETTKNSELALVKERLFSDCLHILRFSYPADIELQVIKTFLICQPWLQRAEAQLLNLTPFFY